MRFCAVTLGCKVNQFETQAIESMLVSRGHKLVGPGDGCDACIINTCAVTAESVRKSRQAVRRMAKMEPRALVAVCGCFSQLSPEVPESLGADIVGGSGNRAGFALEVERLVVSRGQVSQDKMQTSQDRGQVSQDRGQASQDKMQTSQGMGGGTENLPPSCVGGAFEDIPPGGGGARTRALLKIQDGCDNYCAYCIVPYARGRARSLPVARAAENARLLGERGFREIVITGIEISSYGKDLDGAPALECAVREIGAAAPSARLRLGSLDPGAVTGDFCRELGAIPNLCNHFHLSLQSGCDGTLRRMGRKYSAGAAREAIGSLRQMFPGCGITADLIVGFPGETDAEFTQTMEFIKAAGFSGMHIFPYSLRPGTRAADMPEQIEKGVKRARASDAAAAAAAMAHDFRLGQVGKTVRVLFERKRGGRWTGHAGNYIEVAALEGGARNEICDVRIAEIEDGLALGEITRSIKRSASQPKLKIEN